MTEKVRQGLGLLAVAALALVLMLPAIDAEPGSPGGIWRMLTGAVMLVCGIVGLVFLAVGLLRSDRQGESAR